MCKLFKLLFLLCAVNLSAQISTDKSLSELTAKADREYEIGGIQVSGSDNLDAQVITLISGLTIGDKIKLPGDETKLAIKNLWRQRIFDDIGIFVTEIRGNTAFLEIRLTELPKLSLYGIRGNISKSKKNSLREELNLSRGTIVTENLLVNTKNIALRYFIEKGYLNAQVEVIKKRDTTENNSVIVEINIDQGNKVKISDINFSGNTSIPSNKLIKAMSETSRKRLWNIFKSSKYIEEDFETDKKLIIDEYNQLGFRDARIISDSIRRVSSDRIAIDIVVDEGIKYYFRNITWLGNTKYSSAILNNVLNIRSGDVYDASLLQERLFTDPNGGDVSSLYLDNGYLFFDMNPVEVLVENDSIDIEIRLREGRQATISNIIIQGNDRTNDHVILRELKTKPGQLFRRSDIQRSMRELQQLGYFEPTALDVRPRPNAETGTVDIEYVVVERSTSQLELQGGWGANQLVGTLGLSFNNFSAKNITNPKTWSPLPSGDGQTISLRAQSSGLFFQSYSASFTEPWLGGKKPNALTVSMYHNVQNRTGFPRGDIRRQSLSITGVTLGLGKRLKKPDDYFTLYQAVDFQRFDLFNYQLAGISYTDDNVNNIAYKVTLGRNSTDYPIYPRKGSLFNVTLEVTPPYSLLNGKDYTTIDIEDRYRYLEYYKWKVNGAWFTEILPKMVIKAAGEFGYLGVYNSEVGLPPFERFFLGGDGLQNFVLDGREIVGLRGYPNNSIVPESSQNAGLGAPIYNKFTLELRYLLTENPSAQIFMLSFLEGGNTFSDFDSYQPFDLKRSAGFGIRIFMPMFGLLGFDVGYGFDEIPGTRRIGDWQTHFIIGQQF